MICAVLLLSTTDSLKDLPAPCCSHTPYHFERITTLRLRGGWGTSEASSFGCQEQRDAVNVEDETGSGQAQGKSGRPYNGVQHIERFGRILSPSCLISLIHQNI